MNPIYQFSFPPELFRITSGCDKMCNCECVDLYVFPYCFDFLERSLPLHCIVFIISCINLNSTHTRFLILLKWIHFHNHKKGIDNYETYWNRHYQI